MSTLTLMALLNVIVVAEPGGAGLGVDLGEVAGGIKGVAGAIAHPSAH
jgi:hypothetical protein